MPLSMRFFFTVFFLSVSVFIFQARSGMASQTSGFGNAAFLYLRDKDILLQIRPFALYARSSFLIQIGPPMNIELYDRKPLEKDSLYKVIPRKDWDEVSDFGKIIPYVSYGNEDTPLSFSFGQLGHTQLGHGTLWYDYSNTEISDAYQNGISLAAQWDQGGLQFYISDILSPILFGGRLELLPFKDNKPYFLREFSFGGTVVFDSLRRYSKLSSYEHDIDAVAGFGLDAETVIIKTKYLSLSPYADIAIITGFDPRYYLGFTSEFTLNSFSAEFQLQQVFGTQNLPIGMITPLYDIEQAVFPVSQTYSSKGKWDTLQESSNHNLEWVGWLTQISTKYSDVMLTASYGHIEQMLDFSKAGLIFPITNHVTLKGYVYQETNANEKIFFHPQLAVGELIFVVLKNFHLRSFYQKSFIRKENTFTPSEEFLMGGVVEIQW